MNKLKKLTTGQGEDYATGCLLDYDHIKHNYRLIVADLSRQKELDPDSKAIQKIGFVVQSKKLNDNDNATDDGNNQSMFFFKFLEKNKRNTIKFFKKWDLN